MAFGSSVHPYLNLNVLSIFKIYDILFNISLESASLLKRKILYSLSLMYMVFLLKLT